SSSAEQQKEKTQSNEESEDLASESDTKNPFSRHIQWPVKKLAQTSREVEKLGGELVSVFQKLLSCSFFPELQPAIGVGSAFEGWSPDENQAVYCLLMPLKAPPQHTFHLELCNKGNNSERKFRIRVDLECTCTKKQQAKNTLCFVHQSEEELRSQGPRLLSIMCTNSYLDVHRTVRWFHNFVKSSWGVVPETRSYNLKLLPSRRSCKLELTTASGRTLFVEMIFGVQVGDSDIFLVSQTTEATLLPGKIWLESCAVAEAKLLRHMARLLPPGKFHLKCLHVCTRILEGTGFSEHMLKTVVMHLLSTMDPSAWSRSNFLTLLEDVIQHLHRCLENKCLNHFFFGNENVPREIILPPDFQTTETLNLFQHLAQDPAAHTKALRGFKLL
ncbi:IPIL1 protein, partial [Todus mexicanus]|nr:IPIL1 protein [Todus mexicanus]